MRTPSKQIYKDMVLPSAAQFAQHMGACVLVTLVARSGSSPRPVGSQMAVSREGTAVGFISGGCAEEALVAEALQALEAGQPRVVRYGVGSPYIDVVLPCGSSIDVLFTPIHREADIAALQQACAFYEARQPFSLTLPASVIASVIASVLSSVPTGMPVGGGAGNIAPAIRCQACTEAEGGNAQPLASGGVFEGHDTLKAQGASHAYVRRYAPQPRLVIAGRGPIVPLLASLAASMGYEVFAASPDAAMLRDTAFKGTLHMKSSVGYETHIANWLDAHSAFVTTFHDHEWEPSLLAAALESRAFYVGALGSRKTHCLRSDLLAREYSFSAREIARIDGPAGLDIGAVGPNEIALSIMAAVVAAYRRPGLMGTQGASGLHAPESEQAPLLSLSVEGERV